MKEHYHIDKNASDEIFRHRLGNKEEEIPMHLWEGIEKKRSFGHILLNQLKLKWYYGIPVILVLAGVFWLSNDSLSNSGLSLKANQNQSFVQQASLLANNSEAALQRVEQANSGKTTTLSDRSAVGSKTAMLSDRSAVSIENRETRIQKQESRIKNRETSIENRETSIENRETSIENRETSIENRETSIENRETSIEEQATSNQKIETSTQRPEPSILLKSKTFTPQLAGKVDQGCVDFRGNRKGKVYLTLDVLGSPDYSIKRMTGRNSEAVDYISQRENTETFLYGFSGGIRASIVGPRLSFRTGVMYSQINERFELMQQTSLDSMEVMINDTIISGTDTTFYSGLVWITETRNTTQTTYNHYRAIDIPFLMGYNLTKGRRLDMGINGGVFLNVWTQRKGTILSPAMNPVDISSNEYFKPSFGLSVYGGLEMAYHINYNLDFLVEPNVRYNMQPFTEGDYVVIQRYWTGALALGLRYRFN